MAASFFSDFGLMWYLEELKKMEFMKFKELLKQVTAQYGLKQLPWSEVKKASREDLANLLLKHYEEKQAWDVTFSIFHKINRKDLCERATRESAGHTKMYQTHVKKKFSDITLRDFFTVPHDFFNQRITQDERDYFDEFFVSRVTKKRSQTVVINGIPGIGKTFVLTKMILAWSEGSIFPNLFSYVFFFSCREMKHLETTSLAELISREWPNSSVPITEIMSEPEKLLFLLDDLGELNCDLTQPESELSSDWMEKQPLRVLLSSLLRRKMLPESSLIVTGTPDDLCNLKDKLENREIRTLMGFNEKNRKLYLLYMYPDRNQGMEIFHLVKENQQIFTLCQIPVLCWMVGTCLKHEMGKGSDLAVTCRCATSVYTSFILNLFTPKGANCPNEKGQSQLKSLCSLAAEGMWTDSTRFSQEALGNNGILDSDIPTLLDTRVLLKNRDAEDSYTFLHKSVQEFCAAMFYLLRSHMDHPHPDVESIKSLLFIFLQKSTTNWIFLGCFIFGLLHKNEQEKMDVFFGFQLSQEIKQQFYQCLETIGENEDLQEGIDHMKLFYCLFEMQDEAFAQQAMNFFQEVQVTATDSEDLIVSAYCLKYCTSLRKLSLSVTDLLHKDEECCPVLTSRLDCWHQICSVLLTNQNLQIFQLNNSVLGKSALFILHDHLRQPKCTLQGFEINRASLTYGTGLFFEALLSNSYLKHLNFHSIHLSIRDLKLLCNVINSPKCNLEDLRMINCKMLAEDFEVLASVLGSSSKLKHLNVSCNHLNEGFPSLCSALCHPDCTLKFLFLANCSLDETCWEHLFNVLMSNKTLSHLDLSSNALKDEGLKILCEALRCPDSGINSLGLRNCLLTASGCQDLASILSSHQNLRSLQISDNNLGDLGVQVLCEALVHPNCHLENLGLGSCDLTSACCKDLASVFTITKTLWGINLLENALDYSGLATLCESLRFPECAIRVLGLRKSDFDEETQALLDATEKENPNLAILSSL